MAMKIRHKQQPKMANVVYESTRINYQNSNMLLENINQIQWLKSKIVIGISPLVVSQYKKL